MLGIEVLAGLTLCLQGFPCFGGRSSRQGFPIMGKQVREYHSLLSDWVGHVPLHERCPYIVSGGRA